MPAATAAAPAAMTPNGRDPTGSLCTAAVSNNSDWIWTDLELVDEDWLLDSKDPATYSGYWRNDGSTDHWYTPGEMPQELEITRLDNGLKEISDTFPPLSQLLGHSLSSGSRTLGEVNEGWIHGVLQEAQTQHDTVAEHSDEEMIIQQQQSNALDSYSEGSSNHMPVYSPLPEVGSPLTNTGPWWHEGQHSGSEGLYKTSSCTNREPCTGSPWALCAEEISSLLDLKSPCHLPLTQKVYGNESARATTSSCDHATSYETYLGLTQPCPAEGAAEAEGDVLNLSVAGAASDCIFSPSTSDETADARRIIGSDAGTMSAASSSCGAAYRDMIGGYSRGPPAYLILQSQQKPLYGRVAGSLINATLGQQSTSSKEVVEQCRNGLSNYNGNEQSCKGNYNLELIGGLTTAATGIRSSPPSVDHRAAVLGQQPEAVSTNLRSAGTCDSNRRSSRKTNSEVAATTVGVGFGSRRSSSSRWAQTQVQITQQGAVTAAMLNSRRGKGSRGVRGIRARRTGAGVPPRVLALVDLRGLLVSCAEAVAANDARTAKHMLCEMWRHASPLGNGTQRLAHYFALGLAARLCGTGSSSSSSLSSYATAATSILPLIQKYDGANGGSWTQASVRSLPLRNSSSYSGAAVKGRINSSCNTGGPLCGDDDQVLRAYHTYVAVCPFLKLSHFFANEAILSAARAAKRIHIVDFNILYGLQWPCFLKALAEREEGPPELVRITGVDVNYIEYGAAARLVGQDAAGDHTPPPPPPSSSSSWRLDEAGRRLAEYARVYGLRLEYRKVEGGGWERVTWEGLGLRDGEVLAVNCIHRLRHVLEEGVVTAPAAAPPRDDKYGAAAAGAAGDVKKKEWCPREAALSRIRKLNPAVFIEGVVNAAYNAPFFMSRFKEALFHYSSVFDALDSTVRQDLQERLVIERDIMGREIMNVVACEGLERRERPETYRRWQLHTQRVGFHLLPVDPAIKGAAQAIARGFYHKDYGVELDDEHAGHWLLLGWKGRMLHGISCWRPLHSST